MPVHTKLWEELLLYSLSSFILIVPPLTLANNSEGAATIYSVH